MTNGGTDVRLVPAALLGWGTGALVTSGMSAWWAGVVAAVLLGAAATVAVARPAGRHGSVAGTVLLALLAGAAVAGSGTVHLGQREAAVEVLAVASVVEGRVVGDPRRAGYATNARLELLAVADGRPGEGWTRVPPVRLLVRGDSAWLEVEHGTTVRLEGPAAGPSTGSFAPSAPSVVAAPSAPSAPTALTVLTGRREVAELRSGAPQPVAPAQGVAAAVNDLRSGLVGVTEHLGPDARGLVPGTAVGDTRAVPNDLTRAMRDTGLAHVTAVSGAHFSVVLAALLGLGAVLRWPVPIRVAVTTAGVLGFAVLVHPGPAVLRAAVMGAVVVLGLALGRPSRAVPALGWAVVGLVCWDPWTARDVGFHLSVVATAAIVLVAPRLAERLPGPRPLRTAVAVPTAAQAACGPILILLDPVVPLYAVPANMLAVPSLLPATLSGLLATLTVPWGPSWLTDLCLGVAAVAARWLAGVARGFAALPGARVPWPDGAGGAWLLAVVTALVAALVLRLPPRADRC